MNKNGTKYMVLLIATLLIFFSSAMLIYLKQKNKTSNEICDEKILKSEKKDFELIISDLPKDDEMDFNKSSEVVAPFEVTSESVVMFDLKNEKFLYSKNPKKQLAPASLTKIITALVVLELEEDVNNTILTYDKSWDEELLQYGYALEDLASYEYEDGEQMTVIDSLYLMMMRSANDTANMFAHYYGNGDTENFVKIMNQKAKDIGAMDTHFKNAHGIDDVGMYTTAYDMFLITKYALEVENFVEISTKINYTLPSNNVNIKPIEIENILGILNPKFPQYFYPGIFGIKAGYTNEAGKCLITTVFKDDRELLLVIMKVPLKDENGGKLPAALFFDETKSFYNWALGYSENVD